MSSPFPNQGEYLAGSLEISFDIYRMPFSFKGKSAKSKPGKSKQLPYDDRSLSEIMKEVEGRSCGCGESDCQSDKSVNEAFKQNNLFVEKREGQDSLFLDEDDLAPTIDREEVNRTTNHETEEEDPVAQTVLAVVSADCLKDFDPFN